jgi:hypothetical protein
MIAIFAAAGAAATQAGLGYGLGVISWVPQTRESAVTDSGAWASDLAWTALIAASSVVIGAVAGDRSATVQMGRTLRGLRHVLVSLAAAVGGAAIVPLVVIPAQFARVAGTFAPHILVGVYAAVGLVGGLLVALLATTTRAVAANVFVTTVWLWVLAIIVVVHRSITHQPLGYVPLAVWKFTENGPALWSFYLPGALLMLGSALLIGGLAAFPAAGRGAARLGIIVSGAVGPLLVAAAYRLADPSAATTPFEQMSAYHIAPYVAVAGLAGSSLVAAVGAVPALRTRRAKARQPAEPAEPFTYSATATAPFSSRAVPEQIDPDRDRYNGGR